MSPMRTKNKSGPMTDPWGTPDTPYVIALGVSRQMLYSSLTVMGSQCKDIMAGVILSLYATFSISLAALFSNTCNFFNKDLGKL